MTPQENEKLHHFLNQLVQVRNTSKDPEAQALIESALARQPDAAYLLVQRALILEQALDAARAQIADLQDKLQSAAPSNASGRFLPDEYAWGNSASSGNRAPSSPQPAPAYPQPGNMPAAGPDYQFGAGRGQAYPYPPQRQGGWANAGGAGSFLGSMAATAAGVAGGAFLYRGLENMFSHHDAPSHGLGSNLGDAGAAARDSSLARDAGLNDIGQSGAGGSDQRTGLMDDGGSADDIVASDDYGSSDDSGSSDDDSFI
jgi:hypothetical protein